MIGGLAQGGRHAAGDQAELVVGDAGGAIDRQHQCQVDRVHAKTRAVTDVGAALMLV